MGWNHFSRDDENVRWRLGIDVAESEAVLVFVNDIGWDSAVDDFLKDVPLHHGHDFAPRIAPIDEFSYDLRSRRLALRRNCQSSQERPSSPWTATAAKT